MKKSAVIIFCLGLAVGYSVTHLRIPGKKVQPNTINSYSCDDRTSFEKFIDMNKNSFTSNGLRFELKTHERNIYVGNVFSLFIVGCGKSDSEVFQNVGVLAKKDGEFIPDIWFSDYYVSLASSKSYFIDNISELYEFRVSNLGNCFNCEYGEYIGLTNNGLVWLTKGMNSIDNRKTVSRLITDKDGAKAYLVMSEGWDSLFGMSHSLGIIKNYLYPWNENLKEFEKSPTIYPGYFETKIKESKDYFNTHCLVKEKNFSTDPCLSDSISELLNYESMDKRNEGWNIFQNKMANLEKISADQDERSHIQDALNTFSVQIKNGVPLKNTIN